MNLSREEKLKILKHILSWSRRKGDCLICYMALRQGRPRINVNGKKYNISRLIMYLVIDFPLNSDLDILHNDDVCNSKACIEFNHLRVGTQSENTVDFIEKHGPTTLGLRKEYCKWGHLRTPENVSSNGTCRECTRLKDLKRRKRV